MNGIDLKLTADQAAAVIERTAANAVEQLRSTAANLGEQIEHASRVSPMAVVPQALVAAVIDFTNSNDVPGGWTLTVQAGWGSGGNVQVFTPMPAGRYRALVLIDPRPETDES